MFTEGQKVQVVPGPRASEEFRGKVSLLEAEHGTPVIGEVAATSNLHVCTIILPRRFRIEGHSHRLDDAQDYMDIHHSHLREVV